MKKLGFLPLLFVLVSLISCNKQNNEYLLGDWDLVSKPSNDIQYIWSFTQSSVAVMASDANENDAITGELDTCAFGAYILKNGVLTLALPEHPCRGSVYNGDWDIQNLTEDFMTLRREAGSGTQWYEFKKK